MHETPLMGHGDGFESMMFKSQGNNLMVCVRAHLQGQKPLTRNFST